MPITNEFYLFRNCFTGSVSGGDMHTSDIFGYLNGSQLNTKITIIHPENDNQISSYTNLKNLPELTFSSPSFSNFALLYIIRAICCVIFLRVPKSENQKIFIASAHFIPDVVPVFIKSGFDKSVVRVTYIHHIIQEMNRPKSLTNRLANFQEQLCFFVIKNYFDKVVVVNNQVKQSLIERGFKMPILVVDNVINTKPKPDLAKKYDICFCGRMMSQKGVYDFVEIFKNIKKTMPNITGVMIGTGPEFNQIKSLITKGKLNIQLTGFIGDEEKYDIIQKSKIFLFPSIEEGWGIAIAEAMTLGALVIAYDLPVYREVFEHITVVPIGEVQSLQMATQDGLKDMLKFNSQVLNAQIYAKKFNIEKIAQKEFNFMTTT